VVTYRIVRNVFNPKVLTLVLAHTRLRYWLCNALWIAEITYLKMALFSHITSAVKHGFVEPAWRFIVEGLRLAAEYWLLQFRLRKTIQITELVTSLVPTKQVERLRWVRASRIQVISLPNPSIVMLWFTDSNTYRWSYAKSTLLFQSSWTKYAKIPSTFLFLFPESLTQICDFRRRFHVSNQWDVAYRLLATDYNIHKLF
jgi:hypothetical protein